MQNDLFLQVIYILFFAVHYISEFQIFLTTDFFYLLSVSSNKKIVSNGRNVTKDATKQMFDLKYLNDSSLCRLVSINL